MLSLVNGSNPYALEQTIVVGALVSAFVLWLALKPPAVQVLRVLAVYAAMATSFAEFAAAGVEFRRVELECKLALHSSLLLTVCLLAELIGGWRRDRIPRAIARWFR
jgi:hypothetical protein